MEIGIWNIKNQKLINLFLIHFKNIIKVDTLSKFIWNPAKFNLL